MSERGGAEEKRGEEMEVGGREREKGEEARKVRWG